MNEESLHGLVSSVGRSRKNGVAWLNGQFGFGFHAFRGACKSVLVRSRVQGAREQETLQILGNAVLIDSQHISAELPLFPVAF